MYVSPHPLWLMKLIHDPWSGRVDISFDSGIAHRPERRTVARMNMRLHQFKVVLQVTGGQILTMVTHLIIIILDHAGCRSWAKSMRTSKQYPNRVLIIQTCHHWRAADQGLQVRGRDNPHSGQWHVMESNQGLYLGELAAAGGLNLDLPDPHIREHGIGRGLVVVLTTDCFHAMHPYSPTSISLTMISAIVHNSDVQKEIELMSAFYVLSPRVKRGEI